MQRQVKGFGPADLAANLDEPFGARGQFDPAALVPVQGSLTRVEFAIQLDGVHVHPRQGGIGAQLSDQSSGVEGGTTRQLVAVKQHHVTLAELCEVIGNACAANTSTDDDDPGRTRQFAKSRHGSTSCRQYAGSTRRRHADQRSGH